MEPSHTAPAVNLNNCDAEPIHIPGRVQPHGVLFALSGPDLEIVQASANADGLLGVPAGGLVARPLASVLADDGRQPLLDALRADDVRAGNPHRVVVPVGGETRVFDGIAHRHDGRLILELENPRPVDGGPPLDADRLVRFTLTNLQGGLRLREFCQSVAREVRAVTGYDRVMVYRFDHEWNGEVLAEEKRDDLEPFLNLRYPSSDIPAQARRLYHLNLVRHIPDVTYSASPLVPETNPQTGRPLDLTHAVLRSVSPIHVEYLQNMGVAATVTVSILKDGRLWGLIACHHYTTKFLPYRVRAACESLGVLVSLQLSAKQDAEDLRCRIEAQARLARLVAALTEGGELDASLAARADDLTSLVRADGAAVALAGRVTLVGRTPDAAAVDGLLNWLQASGEQEKASYALASEYPPAAGFAGVASGLLAVRLAPDLDDYVLWFRSEVVETVHWAGDPYYKRMTMGPNGPRLSPRGSFKLWQEEQRGRSAPWGPCERDAAHDFRDALLAGLARRATGLERDARRKDDFLAAVAHELRNPLAPIRNAVELLRLRPGDPAVVARVRDLIDRQAGHLGRLVEDLLDASRAGRGKLRLRTDPLDIAILVRAACEDRRPTLEAAGLALDVNAPPSGVWVKGDATRLTQVVGNLLTNAGKFTDRGGKVTVEVSADPSAGRAAVAVSDTGVGIDPTVLPRVFDPFVQAEGSIARSQEGLGLGLALVKSLTELHGGEARAHSDGPGRGATFTIRLPLNNPDQPIAP